MNVRIYGEGLVQQLECAVNILQFQIDPSLFYRSKRNGGIERSNDFVVFKGLTPLPLPDVIVAPVQVGGFVLRVRGYGLVEQPDGTIVPAGFRLEERAG